MKKWDYLVKNSHFVQFVIKNLHINTNQKKNGISKAILPRELAFDFLLFCQRNPKPCPLLEVVEAGEVEPLQFAPGADLRYDTPLYRVYQHGEMVAEVKDLAEFWRDDLVSFLLGCSFSFEETRTREFPTRPWSISPRSRAASTPIRSRCSNAAT